MGSSYCKFPDSSPAITILLAVLLMIPLPSPLNIQKATSLEQACASSTGT